jgi:hypothetical protein
VNLNPVPDLNTRLPLHDNAPKPAPLLAPAWVALGTAWLGVAVLIGSIVFVFLPGTRDPRAELTHLRPYSLADRFLPVPMIGIALAVFAGLVVFWQMRREPRPLPASLVLQRAQASVGIVLALIATAIIYIHVARHGPR